MKVQIAGIKSIYDAANASLAGADAIDLVFGITHKSTDDVDPKTARGIFLSLPVIYEIPHSK